MNTFCLFISLTFLIMTILFIKKRRLEFGYSVLWTMVCIILIILSVNGELVNYLSNCLGIIYAPAFLFLIGIMFSFIMIFYLMIIISDLKKKITKLIQVNALLDNKINERLK